MLLVLCCASIIVRYFYLLRIRFDCDFFPSLNQEIKLEWGKGLAQKREAEARLQELELEKDKPFARNR